MKKGRKKILKSIRRTRNIWFGLGSAALPLALLLLGLTSKEMTFISRWAGRIFGLFFLTGGVFLLWKSILIWKSEKSTVFKLINDSPEKIVWHYTLMKNDIRGGEIKNSTTLFIADIEKNRHPIIVKLKDLSDIEEWIIEKAPNASIGWSKENNKIYRKYPSKLMKS